MTTSPLDDIRTLITTLPGPDEQARAAAASVLSQPGATGRLADIALWLAAWSGKARPQIRRPILALYAGAPGPGQLDAAEGARGALEAVASGQSVVARLAQSAGAGVEAFDLAIDRPIGDIAVGPSLGERECAATMAFGMEVLAKLPDLLMLGEIAPAGPANARAVIASLGTDKGDGLECLRQFATREIAAAAGVILGARIQKVPIILDGLGPCAAALALKAMDVSAIEHCLFASPPADLGQALGAVGFLDLRLTAGDGTAALAALSVVKLAGAVLDPEA